MKKFIVIVFFLVFVNMQYVVYSADYIASKDDTVIVQSSNTSYAEKIIFDAYDRPMKTMSSSNSKLDIPKIEIDNVPSTSKLQQNSQKTNTENTVEIKYDVDTVNKPEIITDKKLNNKAETNIQKDNKISQENSVMYQNYPIMTKNMSTRQKKAFIRKYMENLKYADYAIDDIIENIPWSKVTDDFAPSFYSALDKRYIYNYIPLDSLKEYCANETVMARMNNFIEYMLDKGYSQEDIQTRIRYAKTSIKDSNISDAKLLKSVNKKIPLAEKNKILASIQHWHNTNIYHTGDPDFGNEAVALCAYSCYGGPTFFIVTPLVISGFVVTELLYLPIGLIIGY